MPRRVLLLTLLVPLAFGGCAEDDTPVALSEAEACKAVKERLSLDGLTDRFGEPDASQDFFGDRVVTYEDEPLKWQFQVGAKTGTFRAIRVEGQRERTLSCPT